MLPDGYLWIFSQLLTFKPWRECPECAFAALQAPLKVSDALLRLDMPTPAKLCAGLSRFHEHLE